MLLNVSTPSTTLPFSQGASFFGIPFFFYPSFSLQTFHDFPSSHTLTHSQEPLFCLNMLFFRLLLLLLLLTSASYIRYTERTHRRLGEEMVVVMMKSLLLPFHGTFYASPSAIIPRQSGFARASVQVFQLTRHCVFLPFPSFSVFP